MFIMPDIPIALGILLILGGIIYLILKPIKKFVCSFKEALDETYPDSVNPEELHIKERDKEICRVTNLVLSNEISYKEFKEEIDRIDREYNCQ